MNIYKQELKSDCMLACIANVVQKPINKIFNAQFRDQVEDAEGTHGEKITDAFNLAGLNNHTDYFKVRIPATTDKNIIQDLLQGRRAILQVRSLNYPDAYHMVYWAGETLYDPSNNQIYQWLNQCDPAYIWIFNEIN